MDNSKHKLDFEFEKLKDTIQKPNVLLIGGTGVGKSSLLNYCFGASLAETGVGKPVTQNIKKFSRPNFPVTIYDSKGYEIGSQQEKEFMKDVVKYCTESLITDVEQRIHLVWYCISAVGARITSFDVDTIRQIQKARIPLAILLTKADLISDEDAQALREVITNELPNVPVFETSTSLKLDGLELKKLITWSIESLPEALQIGFIAAQRLSVEAKRQQAKKVIMQHATGAAAVGFSPIPFSDAPLLLANQYALAARIMYIYSLEGLDSQFSMAIKAMMTTILPMVGRYTATQLLKFIPLIGTAVSGMINAGVASALTYAFGYAISETCAKLSEIMLEQGLDEVNDFIKNIDSFFIKVFTEHFKNGVK